MLTQFTAGAPTAIVTAFTLLTSVQVEQQLSTVFSVSSQPLTTAVGSALRGLPGDPGDPGLDGDSAYQTWLSLGNVGTEADFIASLDGAPGDKGDKGDPGDPGDPGISAYQVWLNLGNVGTEADFIASLEGAPGDPGLDGDSAYQTWLDLGNVGTEADFIASLEGPKGDKGDPGDPGDPGPGLPAGGTAGQIPRKVDATDYNVEWSSVVVDSFGGVNITPAENKTGLKITGLYSTSPQPLIDLTYPKAAGTHFGQTVTAVKVVLPASTIVNSAIAFDVTTSDSGSGGTRAFKSTVTSGMAVSFHGAHTGNAGSVFRGNEASIGFEAVSNNTSYSSSVIDNTKIHVNCITAGSRVFRVDGDGNIHTLGAVMAGRQAVGQLVNLGRYSENLLAADWTTGTNIISVTANEESLFDGTPAAVDVVRAASSGSDRFLYYAVTGLPTSASKTVTFGFWIKHISQSADAMYFRFLSNNETHTPLWGTAGQLGLVPGKWTYITGTATFTAGSAGPVRLAIGFLATHVCGVWGVSVYEGAAVKPYTPTNGYIVPGDQFGVSVPYLEVGGATTQRPLSADPADPPAGASVTWVSDGIGTGAAGETWSKITVGATTYVVKLADSNGVAVPATVTQAEHNHGNLGTAITLDITQGNKQRGVVNAGVTITLPAAPTTAAYIRLRLVNSGAGHVITVSGASHIGTATPTLTTADAGVNVLTFDGNPDGWIYSGAAVA